MNNQAHTIGKQNDGDEVERINEKMLWEIGLPFFCSFRLFDSFTSKLIDLSSSEALSIVS
jgi:hypothetical protein